MQSTLLPQQICKEIDKINRNFFWGDTEACKKIHLKNWSTVTSPKFIGGLGIKRAYAKNLALLANRAWALRNNLTDIWDKTLTFKYPPNHSASKNVSTTWADILKADHICTLGTGWRLGNGSSANFWVDNWSGRGPLRSMIHGLLNRNEELLKVCELWDHSGNWCLDRISFHLPTIIKDIICATPKPHTHLHDDSTDWFPSPNGEFSTKSAYHLACDLTSEAPNSKWKWIWKTPTLLRISTFIWLFCHNSLPTKSLLHNRKIFMDSSCPLCHTTPETPLHILLDCTVTTPIWSKIIPHPPPLPPFF
ncbi:hypothetical protein CMV_015706 [Castanea mollissima]|uniref:Reverse transcriptase zinc-binding domain-containing protein n=1 Tax=Castanea mollissima TaxID=60419 RepID=A0A8J4VJU8_9ROSI|nr:hypothetical protein CMV_015706 [Castanea mollissima]